MKPNPEIKAMRERLQHYLAQDCEDVLLGLLRRQIEDPLKPQNQNGRYRANPILVLLAALVTLSGGTFLYFSFVQP